MGGMNIQIKPKVDRYILQLYQDIDGKSNFDKIVSNIGLQLKLPKEDIEGIKLSAMGGSSKRDYLAFDCAMKDKGEVRSVLLIRLNQLIY